ncbi:MaoC family domain-containing protein [Cardiosporidium cionae]|uniref:MaoC family domain-containing protein n=1 Tax=Cardiosporidium cionae TaxID=476202 RepID=A0ABQ7JDX9_9APIC|nr:MaoC family domain-containing protein [Cardiosporidium cionae]|eukprot:KAF8822105.1 MaoC family domain-containing protein [Cardiosporidium cionae]
MTGYKISRSLGTSCATATCDLTTNVFSRMARMFSLFSHLSLHSIVSNIHISSSTSFSRTFGLLREHFLTLHRQRLPFPTCSLSKRGVYQIPTIYRVKMAEENISGIDKPKKVIVSLCEGFVLGKSRKSYTQRDAILYAIGIGASQDPLDPLDLQYTYENSENFATVPSFASVFPSMDLMFEGLQRCPDSMNSALIIRITQEKTHKIYYPFFLTALCCEQLGISIDLRAQGSSCTRLPEFNPMLLLHGEHKLTLHNPIPSEATVNQLATIKNVFDKTSGALVIVKIDSFDESSDALLCSNEASLFLRGIGGFGGTSMVALKSPVMPNRAPEYTFLKKTSANQAIIYRLSGDYNPLHIDPEVASLGGFSFPILHGLCFFGIAAHGAVREVCGNDPKNLYSIEGRFTSPVVPGNTLLVEMWQEDEKLLFKVTNVDTKKACISNGIIHLRNVNRSKL